MKIKCRKCEKLITLNKYELCQPCRTERKKCACGTEYGAEPGQKECKRCRILRRQREYKQHRSPAASRAEGDL